jgi:OOP family OmpA-OmpF porin
MSRLRPHPATARVLGGTAPVALCLVLVVGLTTACGVGVSTNEPTPSAGSVTSPADPVPRPSRSTAPEPAATKEPVQVPPVPLFEIPDLAQLDDAQQGLTASLDAAVADLVDLTDVDMSGLTVVPARCDAQGSLVRDDATVLYGDGSGTYVGADGNESTWNYGDGSGGSFDGEVETRNYGDGSGSYFDGDLQIRNYGDGSGSYFDGDLQIRNYGDGTGDVNGVETEMELLPPLPPLGAFPPVEALQPLAPSCGTLVTLPGGVLFDFDSAELRPEAGAVLDAVAQALGGPLARTSTVIVEGHTDSVSDDAFNLALSQRRADSVVEALVERGVGAPLEAVGLGETLPVAANEIGGVDNPAGRQLNRRVEILIPPV